MQELAIQALSSGGLITNYYCRSACRHCLYRCSPQWPKEYITPDVARQNLHVIRRLGCHSIHIGGGEPLLQPEALRQVLEVARESGVAVEYVETNSSWYRSHEAACAILEKLAGNGLETLLVSISPFHNEFIPFYKIKGVLTACREVGISVLPWISEFLSDLSVFDDRTTHRLEEYEQHFGAGYTAMLPQRYWISSGGRALETLGPYAPHHPVEEILEANRWGCGELANVSHFHIDLYGNYVPGLCAGLAIRREDLGAPLNPEFYPILSCLYTQGVGGLFAYAQDRYGVTPPAAEYASKCHLCYALRRVLVVEKDVNSIELQPYGHYVYG